MPDKSNEAVGQIWSSGRSLTPMVVTDALTLTSGNKEKILLQCLYCISIRFSLNNSNISKNSTVQEQYAGVSIQAGSHIFPSFFFKNICAFCIVPVSFYCRATFLAHTTLDFRKDPCVTQFWQKTPPKKTNVSNDWAQKLAGSAIRPFNRG